MKLTSFLRETLADTKRVATSKEGIKSFYQSSFYRNATYIMLGLGVKSILGLAFWVVVARLYSDDDVGLGSALLSVAESLTFVGTLGLGFGIIRFLPQSREKIRLLNSSFTLAAIVATVAALIFLAGLSLWSPKLMLVSENPVFFIAFVVFVALATIAQVMTQVFIAFRRSGYNLAYHLVVNISKLIMAAGLSVVFKVFGIFASWGIATSVSLVVFLLVFLPQLLPRYRPAPSLGGQASKEMMRFSFANYLSQILWGLPQWILPLMIISVISEEANAYFFMSWTMAGFLLIISTGSSMSLFAEGSHIEERLSDELKKSLKLTILLLLPAILVMTLLGDKLLLLFGEEYSTEGASLLWLLAPASIPASLNFLYLGVARVEKKLKTIVLLTGIIALGTLIPGYLLLSHLDIFGAGVGWLATQTAVALVISPKLIKLIKGKQQIS